MTSVPPSGNFGPATALPGGLAAAVAAHVPEPEPEVVGPLGEEFAGFWRRSLARMIDVLVLAIPLIVAVMLATEFLPTQDSAPFEKDGLLWGETTLTDTAQLWWQIGLVGYALFILVGYYGVVRGGKGGTIGERGAGIRVVDHKSGIPIGTARALARIVLNVVSSLALGLGILWMLRDKKKQTWHDKAVDSVVVIRRS